MMPTSVGIDRIQREQIGHIDVPSRDSQYKVAASNQMIAGRN
jgi:hypothetical protein